MSGARRFGVEFLVVLVLAGAVYGVWWWKTRQAADELADCQAQCETRVTDLRRDAARWAGAVASREAEAAFRAYAAAVAPAVLAGSTDTLQQAQRSLLELPGIVFVHVLGPDGKVLSSSDQKLIVQGQVTGSDATWVLGATDFEKRPGRRPGVVQMAAPIVGPSGAAGYLWMGYDTQRSVDDTRPEELEEESPGTPAIPPAAQPPAGGPAPANPTKPDTPDEPDSPQESDGGVAQTA